MNSRYTDTVGGGLSSVRPFRLTDSFDSAPHHYVLYYMILTTRTNEQDRIRSRLAVLAIRNVLPVGEEKDRRCRDIM